MCSTLGTWFISQLRHGMGPRTCANPVQQEVQKEYQVIICLLLIYQGFLLAYFNLCFWFWLSLWSLLTFFWTQLLILHLLQNVFLCLWQRRMFGVSKTRDRVGWGRVHESSVGSPESE